MKYKAILFDMDGTLLPMDMHNFSKNYFKLLYMKLAKFGLNPESFAANIWTSVSAMVKNDGTKTNEEVFWEKFEELTGVSYEVAGATCNEFYGKEFHEAKAFTSDNPLAKEAVRVAKEKVEKVILSTNPLFPMVGQVSRMSWVGLNPSDFDLITSYESDSYCKPNPKYFTSIFERIGVEPSECLLIGNDENEDMYAGSKAGMDCYLVTDCKEADEEHPWTGPQGTFKEMIEMLKNL